MKVEFISQSIIEDYLDCPYLFYLRHKGRGGAKPMQRQPTNRDTLAMKAGQGVHKVMGTYFKKGRNSAYRELMKYLNRPEQIKEAKELLEQLGNMITFSGDVQFEEEHKLQIGEMPEFRVAFDIVQRSDGHIRVIELKTGWKMKSRMDVEDTLEARYYQFMLERLYPDKKFEISYLYLRHECFFTVDPVPIEMTYLASLVNEIECKTKFEPNFGYCSRCPFILTCDVKIEGMETLDVAARYLRHQAYARTYYEMLKNIAKEEKIELGGWSFFWTAVKGHRIRDFKGFMNFLRQCNVNVKPDMSVLSNKYGTVLEEAVRRGFLDESTYTKFSVIQKK